MEDLLLTHVPHAGGIKCGTFNYFMKCGTFNYFMASFSSKLTITTLQTTITPSTAYVDSS
jgi:hypothetical protein